MRIRPFQPRHNCSVSQSIESFGISFPLKRAMSCAQQTARRQYVLPSLPLCFMGSIKRLLHEDQCHHRILTLQGRTMTMAKRSCVKCGAGSLSDCKSYWNIIKSSLRILRYAIIWNNSRAVLCSRVPQAATHRLTQPPHQASLGMSEFWELVSFCAIDLPPGLLLDV